MAPLRPVTRQDEEDLSTLPPGGVIREVRERRGWTQRELADKVGHIDAAGVSKIETGVTKLGRARATRFARVLGVSLSLLLPPLETQPSLRSIQDRLESLEADVRLIVGNQERLLDLIAHRGELERQAGDHES